MNRRGRLVAGCAILPLLVQGSCAVPNGFHADAIEAWQILRSPDFVLYSQAPPARLEAFALDLARFIAVVEKVVRRESPKTRAEIFLLSGRVEKLLLPHPRIAGLMSPHLSGFHGLVRESRRNTAGRNVLLHEFTHYLTGTRSQLDYPLWYLEGFAEFLSTVRLRGEGMELGGLPLGRLDELAMRLEHGEPIDLREIITFERGARWSFPPAFYSISWATVHYLNLTPERRKRLATLISGQSRGMHWRAAYRRSFEIPIEILSREVERHIEKLLNGGLSTVAFIPLERLDVRDDWEISALSPLEASQRLGVLATRGVSSSRNNLRIARAFFRSGLALEPDDPLSHAGLALLDEQRDRLDEALLHIDRVSEAPAPGVEALVLAGIARRHLAERIPAPEKERRAHAFVAAVQLFRAALAIDPQDPEANAGLGRCLLESEAFPEARAAFARASEFGEWDAALIRDQGKLERRSGNPEAARVLWKRVLARGSPEAAKESQELIEKLDETD